MVTSLTAKKRRRKSSAVEPLSSSEPREDEACGSLEAEADAMADSEGSEGEEETTDVCEGGVTGEGKVKKPRIQGLYKPPTHDELQSLKETQNLFKSNLMKLQVPPPSLTTSSLGMDSLFSPADHRTLGGGKTEEELHNPPQAGGDPTQVEESFVSPAGNSTS